MTTCNIFHVKVIFDTETSTNQVLQIPDTQNYTPLTNGHEVIGMSITQVIRSIWIQAMYSLQWNDF